MFRKKKIIEMRTVLFVDDEEAILRSLKMGLLDEPYIKLFANSAQVALEILQTEQVHVIVADMRMPGMDGIEFLKIVREKYPHIVKIVLSGYTDMPALRMEFKKGEIFKIVSKPWKLKVNFTKVVLGAIEHYNLQSKCDAVGQYS